MHIYIYIFFLGGWIKSDLTFCIFIEIFFQIKITWTIKRKLSLTWKFCISHLSVISSPVLEFWQGGHWNFYKNIYIYICDHIMDTFIFYMPWFYIIVFDYSHCQKWLNCLWFCCKKVKSQNFKQKNRSSADVSHHSPVSRGLQSNLHELKYGRVCFQDM